MATVKIHGAPIAALGWSGSCSTKWKEHLGLRRQSFRINARHFPYHAECLIFANISICSVFRLWPFGCGLIFAGCLSCSTLPNIPPRSTIILWSKWKWDQRENFSMHSMPNWTSLWLRRSHPLNHHMFTKHYCSQKLSNHSSIVSNLSVKRQRKSIQPTYMCHILDWDV